MPARARERLELHFKLQFTDVLARWRQGAERPVRNEAFLGIERNGRQVPFGDIQEQATEAVGCRPIDNGVNQSRSNSATTYFWRYPHGEQVRGVVPVVMSSTSCDSKIAFTVSGDECDKLVQLALPILARSGACLVESCSKGIRRVAERTQPNRTQSSFIARAELLDPGGMQNRTCQEK
jgi:hypothetical protein